jgi:hypothetical protein
MPGERPYKSRTHPPPLPHVVPQAHYAVLDRDLQMTLYELFHTNRISRVGHAVCTPIVCFSALAALAQIRLPSPLDAPRLSPGTPSVKTIKAGLRGISRQAPIRATRTGFFAQRLRRSP